MEKSFTIRAYAANVSANPHPAGTYERLIQRAFSQRRPIQIWGERYALMTELHWRKKSDGGSRTAARGVISTFTDIDTDAPWLNRKTGKAAEEDDTNRIVIPNALRPHFAQFAFYFDFTSHVFAFQGSARMAKLRGGFKAYSLTPIHVKTYLTTMFSNEEVMGEIDSVNVTIIPDHRRLSEILRSDNIREISMTVTTPNSDNIATERGRVRSRLNKIRAKKKVETYVAVDKEGIQPDSEMRAAAKVAALDGEVTARVLTNEGTTRLSTSDKPFVDIITIDPNIEPATLAIDRELKHLAKNVNSQ